VEIKIKRKLDPRINPKLGRIKKNLKSVKAEALLIIKANHQHVEKLQ